VIALKAGVSLRNLQPQALLAAIVADQVFAAHAVWHPGGERLCVITSANDSKHKPNSLHPKGLALDIRTRTVANAEVLAEIIGHHLGPDFDVIAESDHIHVEWDPDSNRRTA